MIYWKFTEKIHYAEHDTKIIPRALTEIGFHLVVMEVVLTPDRDFWIFSRALAMSCRMALASFS